MAARIETLSAVVRYTAALKGYYLPCSVWMSLSHRSPKRHIDANIAFITDGDCAFLLCFSIFEINGTDGANIEYRSNYIYNVRLNKLFNFIETGKSKTIPLDFVILSALFTNRIF